MTTVRPGYRRVLALIALALGAVILAAKAGGAGRPKALAAPGWPPGHEPALADTAYPVPGGASFVAPGGDDSGPGTPARPWRTIGHAVAAAPSGAVIVIRAGVYREEVVIRNKTLTLQPFPHEQVWLRGSQEVAGWRRDRDAWRYDGWPYRLPRREDVGDKAHPLAGYAEMVFVDGAPLKQVGRRKDLGRGTFLIDREAGAIFLGADPAGRTVEVSAFTHAIRLINAPGTVVRGLGFAHYASPAQDGSVRADERSRGLRFERNTFAWNAAAGLSLLAADCVVRDNLLAYNGQLGVHAFRTHRLLIEGNRIIANNQEGFDMAWEAGGVKMVAAEGTTWRDNVVLDNLGTGLWCDIGCTSTTMVRNLVRGNARNGILYEISAGAIIASNLVIDNARHGVSVSEAQSVAVYNNTLLNNRQQIRVIESGREPAVSDIAIHNNLLAGGPRSDPPLLEVSDSQSRRGAAEMRVRADHNAYRPAQSGQPLVAWLADGRQQRFIALDAFTEASGQEASGLQLRAVPDDKLFADPARGDYRLRADSPALKGATPLPAEVAGAIGIRREMPVGRGALHFPTQVVLPERDTDDD